MPRESAIPGIRRNKRTGKYTVTVESGPHPETGRRQRITREARTRDDAIALRDELIAGLAAGVDVSREAARLTVAQFLHDWLVTKRPDMTPNGWRHYEYMCRAHLAPYLGGLRLQKLTPLDYRRFDAQHEVSPTLRFKRYWTLHAALKEAVYMQLLMRNPLDAVRPPARPQVEHDTWSLEEVERWLAFAEERDQDDSDACALIALTGLRIGEMLGQLDAEVYLGDLPYLAVTQQAQWGKSGSVSLVPTKTKAGARHVGLPVEAVRIVERVRARRKVRSLRGERLFPTLHPHTLRKHFQALCEEQGFPVLTLHELRHTTASLLASAGVGAKAIQVHMGHASYGVTMDLYAHLGRSVEADAVRALNALLGASRKEETG